MKANKLLVASLLALTVLAGGLIARAAVSSPRQYYGGWNKHPRHTYHYRIYYYKPTPSYAGYRHHYVIHHPQRPNHHYYYNPYKKQYWGRCPSQANGKPEYSMLAEADRKETLEEIPEKAFPKPAALPPIPDSDPAENATLDLPPDDLPPAEGLPKGSP